VSKKPGRAAPPPGSARPDSERKRKSGVASRRGAKKRRRRIGLVIAIGLALLVLGPAVSLAVFALRPGPSAGQRVDIDVPAGLTASELAELLYDEGLVSNELLASLYLGLAGELDVAPGEHLLPGGSTPSELRALLVRSPTRPTVKVTIPEGWNRFQIAARMESLGVTSERSFLAATVDPLLLEALEVPAPPGRGPDSAEGYLFPATYKFELDVPAAEVVTRLVNEAHLRWRRVAEAGLGAEAKELGWGRAEIVSLASIIEKEAAADGERPTISSVFYNRMLSPTFTPKLLQSDPTSAYGCLAAPDEAPSCANFAGKVRPEMNRDKQNRWSTYTHEGLPPGPISNPGEKSLAAALAPEKTEYFFFVAKGGGHHQFSATMTDHQKAIGHP